MRSRNQPSVRKSLFLTCFSTCTSVFYMIPKGLASCFSVLKYGWSLQDSGHLEAGLIRFVAFIIVTLNVFLSLFGFSHWSKTTSIRITSTVHSSDACSFFHVFICPGHNSYSWLYIFGWTRLCLDLCVFLWKSNSGALKNHNLFTGLLVYIVYLLLIYHLRCYCNTSKIVYLNNPDRRMAHLLFIILARRIATYA